MIKQKMEEQIAKENINELDDTLEQGHYNLVAGRCEEHKQTCERFLEFLEDWTFKEYANETIIEFIENKITDLKKAIKIYKDAEN